MSILLRSHQCMFNMLRISNVCTKISATELNGRNFCTAAKKEDPRRDLNEPAKFMDSPAASWKAIQNRRGTLNYDEIPWFQTYVVVGSVAVFLIYFCILREENDIDEEMGKTLYERVPGLEETQLIINFKYNYEHGIDNTAIIARMKELGMEPEKISI